MAPASGERVLGRPFLGKLLRNQQRSARTTPRLDSLGPCLVLMLGAFFAAQPVAALPKDKTITQFAHRAWPAGEGSRIDTIESITQCEDGFIWLASHQGLARFDGHRFHTFGSVPELDEDLVFLVKADRRGRLWVGSAAGLVMQQDGRWTSFHQDHGLPHPLVRAMVEDRQGQLWVGTQQGAAVFDEASGRFRPLEKLDQDPTAVISLNIASDGSVWMGTETGVVSWREGGDVRTFTTADGLPNDVVRTRPSRVPNQSRFFWSS